MLSTELLAFFARSYEPPWVVAEELLEGAEPLRSLLTSALESIPPQAISRLDEDARAQSELVFRRHDPELQWRLHLLCREAASAVQRPRIEEIAADREVLAPYDHSALTGLSIDDEGLVPLSAFRLDGDTLYRNGYAFFVLPPIPASNACYWLIQEFARLDLIDSVSVRLDPFLYGPADEFPGQFYKAAVYGRPLDWKRIRSLRAPEHGRWVPDSLNDSYSTTECAWLPNKSDVEFFCEELPAEQQIAQRGSRYLHAIYSKTVHQITHLDGAVRIYGQDDFKLRTTQHVRNAGKSGIRVKVFRLDRLVAPDALGTLAQAFFYWNEDVTSYFSKSV